MNTRLNFILWCLLTKSTHIFNGRMLGLRIHFILLNLWNFLFSRCSISFFKNLLILIWLWHALFFLTFDCITFDKRCISKPSTFLNQFLFSVFYVLLLYNSSCLLWESNRFLNECSCYLKGIFLLEKFFEKLFITE